jgi:hypothetical protein
MGLGESQMVEKACYSGKFPKHSLVFRTFETIKPFFPLYRLRFEATEYLLVTIQVPFLGGKAEEKSGFWGYRKSEKRVICPEIYRKNTPPRHRRLLKWDFSVRT